MSKIIQPLPKESHPKQVRQVLLVTTVSKDHQPFQADILFTQKLNLRDILQGKLLEISKVDVSFENLSDSY